MIQASNVVEGKMSPNLALTDYSKHISDRM